MESDTLADHYYNGLNWKELSHDDRCRLIFMIEAAAYCESHGVEDIRRANHKELCDQRLRKVTASEQGPKRDSFGGTYGSIANNPELLKIYFDVTKPKEIKGKKKRNTRIRPHIPEIKQLVESKKSTYDYKSEMRVLKPPYNLIIRRSIFEPSIKVSDAVSAVVIRANQRKEKKAPTKRHD
jgi:hypothetical protein